MTRVSIRHIDVVRAANIAAVLYAVIVLFFMLVFVLPFTLIAGAAASAAADEMGMGAILGAGVVGVLIGALFGAVIYGIIGWITTAIAVALFNFVAGRLGGLQADVAFESPLPLPPGYGTPYGYPQAAYGAQPPVPPANWGQPQG